MTVQVQVIVMIANGIFPKMSFEECTQLNQDVLDINEARREES